MSNYPEYTDGRGMSLYHSEEPGMDPRRASAHTSFNHLQPSRAPSTQSWVDYNLQYPPPPPDEDTTPQPTPGRRASRPLPDPMQHIQHNGFYHSNNPTVLRLTNATLEDDEEYMDIPQGSGMEEEYRDDYRNEAMEQPPVRPMVHRVPAPPVDFRTMRYEDVGPLRQEEPYESPRRNFVGGFFSGLRRLPRMVMRRSSKKSKKKQDAPAYTESYDLDHPSPSESAGLERGNTLPRYVANPGNVSRPVLVEATEMPTPMRAEYSMSANLGPSLSRPRPSWHVTPPSDVEEADEDIGMTPEIPQTMPGGMIQSSPPETPRPMPPIPENTVTVYDLPQSVSSEVQWTAPATPSPLAPPVFPPPVAPPPPSASPVRHPSRSSLGRRSSRRTGTQASPPPSTAPVQAHLQPAPDYRKMAESPLSRSSYTSDLSDGPSFSEQRLNPLFRFVRTLWYMPWVAPKRVTVDYRPGGRGRSSKYGIAESKKPSRTWYRGNPGVVLSPRSSNTIDLLSPGGASAAAEQTPARSGAGANRRLSMFTTSTRWQPAPTTRPSRRRTTDTQRRHHRRPHQRQHHRTQRHDRRRDTTSTVTTTQFSAYRFQTPSPVLPAVYPFPYPYPYGYPAFQPPERSKTSAAPRGPRAHHHHGGGGGGGGHGHGHRHGHGHGHGEHAFPHGYAHYQPFAAPPMYFIQTTPPGTSGPGEAQVAQPMYMPVQVIPGAFGADTVNPRDAGRGSGNTSRRSG